MWHHFGDNLPERSCDLIQMYKRYFMTKVDPDNLAKLMEQYNWRSLVSIHRDDNVLQIGDSHTIKVQIGLIIVAFSLALDYKLESVGGVLVIQIWDRRMEGAD